jgi:biotin carboxyl carrier protein
MKRSLILFFIPSLINIATSCNNTSSSEEEQAPVVSVKSTSVIKGDIEEDIRFNGSTVYLKKNMVTAPIAGYIVKANVKFGQEVQAGDILFEIQTRENLALASEKSSEVAAVTVKVKANSGGFINELSINEAGVFITEGGTLCNIVDIKDLVVKVNVPFEYNSLLNREKRCRIGLADKTSLAGTVIRILPVVDEVNQTQTVYIKPETSRQLPENLNLSIIFSKERHLQTLLIGKSALMANETQDEFWVMKIFADTLAVKVPVRKGIVNDTIAEIVSSSLKVNDLIISKGAYGLPDSSSVRIVK